MSSVRKLDVHIAVKLEAWSSKIQKKNDLKKPCVNINFLENKLDAIGKIESAAFTLARTVKTIRTWKEFLIVQHFSSSFTITYYTRLVM